MTLHEINLLDIPHIAGLEPRKELDGISKYTDAKHRHISELISASFPFTRHYGAYIEEQGKTFALGICLDRERMFGNLTFISPADMINELIAQKALEYILTIASGQKMIAISAETDDLEILSGLKKVGFSTYYTQKIWRLARTDNEQDSADWVPIDKPAKLELLHLYSQVTPPMIQFLEPFPSNKARLMRYKQERAFVAIFSGSGGVLAIPYFLPEAEDGAQKLLKLINSFKINKDQEIFILTKSTMGWIETWLEDAGAEMLEEQKVCFRRLVNPIPLEVAASSSPAHDTRMVPTSIEKHSIQTVERSK